jgi:hypothetical protein
VDKPKKGPDDKRRAEKVGDGGVSSRKTTSPSAASVNAWLTLGVGSKLPFTEMAETLILGALSG